jgi:methyl-accepting chemotaxis protein
VASGTRQVQEAGATMNDIVQAVRHVAEVIAEVGCATTGQRSGMAQVNEALSVLERTTQQNAALVEQSAAAAESLRSQADRLHGLVGTFQLVSAPAPAAESHPRRGRFSKRRALD